MTIRQECPVCGNPNLEAVDCDLEPVDCIFCLRCGWVGSPDITENDAKNTDSDKE